MTLGQRIRHARGTMSRRELADRLAGRGVTVHQNTIEKYEHEKTEAKAGFLTALAEELQLNEAWLLTGAGPMARGAYAQGGSAGLMTEHAASGAPGGPTVDGYAPLKLLHADADRGVLGDLALRPSWLRAAGVDPAAARVLAAPDDAMDPAIRRGDLVVVDTAVDRVGQPGVYVLDRDDAYEIRGGQVSPRGNTVLTAEDGERQKESLPPEEAEALFVVGRVVLVVRKV